MRTPWKLALVSALALTALLGLSSPAAATHTGTVSPETIVADNGVVLGVDEYIGYTFTLSVGESITYAIEVLTPSSTTTIDVYFFSASGLAAYRADPPATTQAILSLEDQSQFGGTFSSGTGAITVILDNVNGTGVAPTGQVTLQVGLSSSGGAPNPDLFSGIIAMGILLCVGVIAIIVVVIVLIIYAITRANRPAMPPPGPPYMPPPQQPWPPQPPQQPPEQYPPQYPPQNP